MTPGLQRVMATLRQSRPQALLGGLLTYGLGAAIARYQGNPIDLRLYLLGQATITALQAMSHFQEEASRETGSQPRDGATAGSKGTSPQRALHGAVACLALAAVFACLLLLQGGRSAASWLLLVLVAVLSFFQSASPIRLSTSGYGEVIQSITIAGLVPAFAAALQGGGVTQFLVLTTAPVAALHFAMQMAVSLPEYEADSRSGRQTLIVRLGWRTGMRLHDAAIVLAIAAMILAGLAVLPDRAAWGTAIALPMALAEMWQLQRIRSGHRPNWPTLKLNAYAMTWLTAYLLLVGLLQV